MKHTPNEISKSQNASVLRKLMRIAIVTVVVLVCTGAAVFVFHVPLSLSPFKNSIEVLAQESLGMGVAIDGDLHLIPGWSPAVEIRELRLLQPDQQGDLLSLEYLKVGIAIFPLLKRNLHVTEIVAQEIDLRLTNFGGSPGESAKRSEVPDHRKQDLEAIRENPVIRRVEVTLIDLRDATIAVDKSASPHTVAISEIMGTATEKDGVKLNIKGAYRNIPWTIAFNGHSLTNLLERPSSWPLDLSADYAGAELDVSGRINPADIGAALDMRLSGSIGPELKSLLGDTVAEFEKYRLAFHLDITESKVQMTALDGSIDTTEFTGNCRWNEIDRLLSGAITVTELDVRPLLHSIYPTGEASPKQDDRISSDESTASFLTKILPGPDIDFRITIDRIVGLPGDLRNAKAHLFTTDGDFRLPASINVLGTTVTGEVTLARREDAVDLAIDLATGRTDLRRLSNELSGRKKITGGLDGLKLTATSSGADLDALVKNLGATFDLQNADFSISNDSANQPMRIVLESAALSLPSGGSMKVSVTGILLDKPFSVDMATGGMRDIVYNDRWPVELAFTGSGARLYLTGTLTPLSDTTGPELSIRLSGDRLGDLAAWTGISPSAEMPYVLGTDVQLHQNRRKIEIDQLTLGNSKLQGTIGVEFSPNRQAQTNVSIQADLVDVRQLKTVFLLLNNDGRPVQALSQQERTKEDFARILDTMVFPETFHLPEIDVNIDIRRLLTDTLAYERCSLKAHIQKNHTTESHVQFDLGETSFRGEAFLNLIQEPPELGLRFSTSHFELGELLDALSVAKGVDASVRIFEIDMTTRGRRISDLILQREISARAEEGRWVLKDTHTTVDISLDKAEYADRPDEPFRLDLLGHIENIPVKIRWEIQKKHPEDAPGRGRAHQFDADVADAHLALTGHVAFPLRRRGVANQLTISGNRLNSLEPLLNVPLPPLGPYEASGVIRILPEGYSLSDAAVSIGDSRFLGQFNIVTEGPRQKVEVNLKAKTIQLMDFDFVDSESASGQKKPTAAEHQAGNSVNVERRRQLRRLIDPSEDSTIDAKISIEVSEVLAGANRLGGGTLRIIRGDNRLSISPLALSIPGGDVSCALELTDTGSGINGALEAEIHQLDFGPLLRLKNPNTTSSGRVSMVIDLESTAGSIDALLSQANGRFAVSIQPENIGAKFLDFWATNILMAILPVLNPNNESKINCIIADLSMADGIMKEKAIVVDTSKIRVRGKAHADFKKQTVYLRLSPTPKRPQFLSLATPLEVSGKFSDFSVGLATSGLVGTFIRLLTAHIVVPIQWIILNNLPEDGRDVCSDVTKEKLP